MVKAKKFGAISGVFTPSILTILGVIMYLRLPWIVGQAGLWATIGIILVAHIISFTTGLSVASIATDKKIETGGSYYIISRSLGLPIGGTLGLALFVGLSFSVSLYLIGFAEVFLGIFGFEATINNIRITGAVVLALLTILTFISTSLVIKAQYIILIAIVLSLLSIIFGNHEHTPEVPLFDSMGDSLSWIALFAIFFPAVTGFEAGVSMSGDLKDPRKNIPIGTIAAVLTGLLVYIGLAFFLSYSVDRELLVNDPSVLFIISWIPQLVIAGILGATLSSALGSILGAPRILQATAIDRITPVVFGKGFGASNEPRNALLLTFAIALSGILIGELNVIARIVTIFFIITYGFLNITYAVESWAGTDFRPTFRIPGFISIIGAITCIVVMIQLDIVAMIGASLLLIAVFLYLKKKELTLQTGDTWNSVWTSLVKTGLGKLTAGNREPRNWRPNIILFSGGAKNRPHLIEIAKTLVGKLGIFTNFELVENKDEKTLFSKGQQVIEEEAISRNGVFTRRHVSRDVYEGMESIAKIYGFSGFEPNTILMGWPVNSKNPDAFTRLARKFKKLDYNQVYLHYDKTSGFGKKKNIDLWWSGKGRNISMALTLWRFISSSEHWRRAHLRILVINNHFQMTEKYHELIDQILENTRVSAEVKVINNSVEKLPALEIMRSESINTDLSIIEMDQKDDQFFDSINRTIQVIPTCIILSASSFFEEHNVVERTIDERIEVPEDSPKPRFSVVHDLKFAPKEIIANEVYKAAKNLEEYTRLYFENGWETVMEKSLDYYQNLETITEKTTEQLYRASKTEEEDVVNMEFLRIINDFSYHAQATLKTYKQEVIANQRQDLYQATQKYFERIQKQLQEIPHYIRIKYGWKEYRLLKADSAGTRLLKMWKLIKSRILGRPAIYKINSARAARYLLYHKRLILTQRLFNELARHSYENIITIRNTLAALYELAEKGKSPSVDKIRIKNSVQMEKDRFKASLSLLGDTTRNFYYKAGETMAEKLLDDLQNFNNLLARPGSNNLSRVFPKAYKNDAKLLEELLDFPRIWHTNANLFLNKVYLDFLLQSLKNRIEAKIRKFNDDFRTQLFNSLLQPLNDLKLQLQEIIKKTNMQGKKPERSVFVSPSLENHYNKLFEEINLLFNDLPIVLSIAGEDLSKNLEEKKFEEAREIVVSLRKTVEFSIASELIDQAKKHATEASLAYDKSVLRIKDIVRLVNFNLFDETDTEIQNEEEKAKLVNDFIAKIEQEERTIQATTKTFESSFIIGLNNTFAPLSSAVIAKTSGSIQKKYSESRNRMFYGQLEEWKDSLIKNIQKQFVRIVYTQSESILWMGRMEKPAANDSLSNEEVYNWLDLYSPKQKMVDQLPFYYGKLFSGHSGIGEDFWVGMEEEVARAAKAISRFREGQPGCLIITGERNAGKTSLSKHIARQHFSSDEIHNIRAPRECNADVAMFESTLLRSLNTPYNTIETALQELPKPVTFILNDLELWWERKNDGTQVVEKLLSLIRNYYRKAFFIININIYTLRLIDKLTGLQSWAAGIINCTGFDAKELRDMIMLRHKAGGMSFVLDKKHEVDMTAWNYASLFNRIFNLSAGNPGLAVSLWLASINKVTGKSIHMRKLPAQKPVFLNKLNREQVFILLQFVYHSRLGIDKLTQIIDEDKEDITRQINILWQTGILVEKFQGIFSINPALQQHIVFRLREMKLL